MGSIINIFNNSNNNPITDFACTGLKWIGAWSLVKAVWEKSGIAAHIPEPLLEATSKAQIAATEIAYKTLTETVNTSVSLVQFLGEVPVRNPSIKVKHVVTAASVFYIAKQIWNNRKNLSEAIESIKGLFPIRSQQKNQN